MIFHCSFRHICTTHIPAGVKGVADGSLNTQLTVPRNDKHKSSETVVTGRPFLRPQKVKHLFHAAIRSYFQQFKGKKTEPRDARDLLHRGSEGSDWSQQESGNNSISGSAPETCPQ